MERRPHFDAPATLCGWCFHRNDWRLRVAHWWLRPDEWGGGTQVAYGGWVCGNCHPDPRKEHNITIWTADPREL